jgi:hypothetical protein
MLEVELFCFFKGGGGDTLSADTLDSRLGFNGGGGAT